MAWRSDPGKEKEPLGTGVPYASASLETAAAAFDAIFELMS
jgi:hypothetical protein